MHIRAVIMGLTFALIWSSAFTSAKIIVQYAPPFTISAIRFFIAGSIAIILAKLAGQTWRLSASGWRATFIFGLCQNALYLGLNFFGMQTIDASLAAIIASTMPLIVVVLNRVFFGEQMKFIAIIGLFLGFAGVTLILGYRFQGDIDSIGFGACVIAAIALSVATLTAKGASSQGNILMVVGLQMLVGGALLAPVGLLLESRPIDWQPMLIGAFVYTVIFPGLIATWIWFTLVNLIGPNYAATYHFLNPFFGVLVAAIILGENLGWQDYIGVCVIAAGIYAVQRSRISPAKPAN